MKTNCIVKGLFARAMATTAQGYASFVRGAMLMAFLFVFMAASSAMAQTLQFTFPTLRATVPVNYSNVVAIPINNSANTNGLAVSTNGASLDINGFYHLDPVNLNVSGLPAGVTYSITSPDGIPLTQIGNAATNLAHLGYETNSYHTNLVLLLFCTNVAQGTYTFNLNAGGDGSTTPGLPTNSIPLVLQAAHIWNGNGGLEASFGVSNNWTDATSWLGGVPTATDDVVFGDVGGQTNTPSAGGLSFTNIGISSSLTVASIRFASTVYTNLDSTNALTHTLQIASNATLFVTGAGGFSLLRDYINAFGQVNDRPDRQLNVNLIGTNAALWVSNAAANFTLLHGSASSQADGANTLNMTNLDRFTFYGIRMGLAEYQLMPNYAGLNKAFNGNAGVTNDYTPRPGNLAANVYLARTNIITATYKDPNNYTNENRTYALSFESSEQQGLGGAPLTTILLGVTNRFFLDSVVFVHANHQGFLRFGVPSGGAVFRSTNGTGRLSVVAISDDGGTTNMANSNVKATIDFAAQNGVVDILADRLYIARDRTLISSNQTPNVQGSLLVGKGNVDVNTAVLGFQEHSNKMDWPAFNPTFQAYLNYCQGSLTVTNGGTFRVNGTMTLGYTADPNPVASAQQYNTFGRITVYAGSTLAASNIVCDGGENFYDLNLRQNSITVNQGTLVVSNTIGAVAGLPAFDPRGLPLDSLTMNGATLILNVAPGKTNVFVRTLSNPGAVPTTVKVGAPISGLSVFPTNLPIISYESATPFMAADTSVMGTGTNGYILIDDANKLVTLFLTTNAPKNLVWVGGDPAGPSTWNLTTTNWLPAGGGSPTAFSLGDLVTFNDNTLYTNITIAAVVVPNQIPTNTGVIISNMTQQYTFNAAGGAIAGTAQLRKTGTNLVTFNAPEAGPLTIEAGTVSVGGSGIVGSTTLLSNNCVLNLSGTMNGSLISTGAVTVLSGGNLNGAVTIGGGSLVNDGTITITPAASLFSMNGDSVFTNTVNGLLNLGSNSGDLVAAGCTVANLGTINTFGYGAAGGRLNCRGLYFGTGTIYDPIGGTSTTPNAGRFVEDSQPGGASGIPPTIQAIVSPGDTPNNSIGTLTFGVRLDLSGNNPQNSAGKLLLEVDQAGSTYDQLICDKWNTIANIWVMTNLNGSFSSGQIYHILVNSAPGFPNIVDTPTIWPNMSPTVPGPGLQWNLSRVQVWGDVMVTNSSMIWDGASSTSWDTNGVNVSWKSGKVFGNNQGAIFDERASTFTVTLSTPVAPAGFNLETNTAGPGNTFFTNTPAFMPGIIVSNDAHPYLFVASPTPSIYIVGTNSTGTNSFFGTINGMTSLYKTGPGLLTILTTNSYTGGVTIDGGTVAYTNGAALGVVPGQRYQYSSLTMDNNATLSYFGATNAGISATGNRALIINAGGATLNVSNALGVLTLDKEIYGDGALTKTGAGTLQLTASGNYYGGLTTVNEGCLQLSAAAAASNSIILANNTVLALTNSFTLTNAINVAGGSATVMQLGNTLRSVISNGRWTGSGTLTLSNAAGNTFVFNNIISNYSGTFSFGNSAGSYLLNNATNNSPCKGSPLATFDLGTGTATLSNFNGGALTYDLGGLAGGAGTILAGRATNNVFTNATSTYSIGANGSNTVFSGVIADGTAAGGPSTVSVIKVGTGSLLLNGASTFTGGTTVSNGILGGTGSIAGALTVTANGTLSPGASVGKFTVGGNAALNGKVFMELNRTNTPATNDQLSVTGTISATGGILVVTNIGPDIYNGSKFQLFNQAVTGWSSKTLPATDPTGAHAYTWTDNIGTDGSITLFSGGANPVNTNPTNITFSVSGNALTLNWPADHIGWQLWSNSVSLVNTGMWFQIAGSAATNKVIIIMDPTKTNVFFRLTYP